MGSAVNGADAIDEDRREESRAAYAQRPEHPVETRLLGAVEEGTDDKADGADRRDRGGEVEGDGEAPGRA